MLGTLDLSQTSVTVVGAGISGLLAAWQLDRAGFEVTLIDRSNRAGGQIRTTQTQWGLVEAAAHTILATPQVLAALQDLDCPFETVSDAGRKKFIVRNAQMRRFPLTPGEAAGLMWRMVRNRRSKLGPVDLRTWGETHVGRAATQWLLSPMIAGIYGARPEDLSVAAAFPRAATGRTRDLFSGARGVMATPRQGMEGLVARLEARLSARLGSRFRLGTAADQATLRSAGNLVICVPTDALAQLLDDIDPAAATALTQVRYSDLVSATVFAKTAQFKRIPQGTGVLIPESERTGPLKGVLGVLFNSSAFPHKVSDPTEIVSLTVMLEGAQASHAGPRIQSALEFLFGFSGAPLGLYPHHWPRAIPLYGPELERAWELLRAGFAGRPGRVVFGNHSGDVSLRGMTEAALKFGASAHV